MWQLLDYIDKGVYMEIRNNLIIFAILMLCGKFASKLWRLRNAIWNQLSLVDAAWKRLSSSIWMLFGYTNGAYHKPNENGNSTEEVILNSERHPKDDSPSAIPPGQATDDGPSAQNLNNDGEQFNLSPQSTPESHGVSFQLDNHKYTGSMESFIRLPLNAHRILSREEFKLSVRIGQHYAVRRWYLGFPLFHHFLISKVTVTSIYVLHYNGSAKRYFESFKTVFGQVVEEEMGLDDQDLVDVPMNLYKVADSRYPSDEGILERLVEKARSRLGEAQFGITYNNCEHFVRWALTGDPHCEQYEHSTVNDKVVGSVVDELPHIGYRLGSKVAKEALYAGTALIEQATLAEGARLVRHTTSAASSMLSSLTSTASATVGLSAPVEAGLLALRIARMRYLKSEGSMSEQDYRNATDRAITGSVFSVVWTALGAIIGQLVIPLPMFGAIIGSFLGGFIGRLIGISLAGLGIALKEKFWNISPALQGDPCSEQYENSTLTQKAVGFVIDELHTYAGKRIGSKIIREGVLKIVGQIQKLVLPMVLRRLSREASWATFLKLSSITPAARASFVLSFIAEAIFVGLYIYGRHRLMSEKKINEQDYKNSIALALSGSIFSTLGTALGTIIGTILCPPIGGILGPIFGGSIGRLIGIVFTGILTSLKNQNGPPSVTCTYTVPKHEDTHSEVSVGLH